MLLLTLKPSNCKTVFLTAYLLQHNRRALHRHKQVVMFQGKINFLTGHPVVAVTFCNVDFLLLKNRRAQRVGS